MAEIVLHDFEVQPLELTPELASEVDLPLLPWQRHSAVEQLLAGAAMQSRTPIVVSDRDSAVHIGRTYGRTERAQRATWLNPAKRVPFFLFMSRGTLKEVAIKLDDITRLEQQNY